jgi:hypothetical protein
VVSKNQIAVQDTFARGNIQAIKHKNGVDWWINTPKSHSNCYFLTLVNAQGVQPAQIKCEGTIWNDKDSQGQAVFSPNGKKIFVLMVVTALTFLILITAMEIYQIQFI